MIISGPYITETVLTVECREQLDLDAYWNLDFDGTELPRGEMPTLLYARVAWPTLREAQEQWGLERDAMRERNRRKPQARGRRRKGTGTP